MIAYRLPRARPLRAAFTLVELLAVIAIIAVLIGLTTAAVQKVRVRTLEMRTRSDISQLSVALDSAKAKYNVDYFPSRIRLQNGFLDSGQYKVIDIETRKFLGTMWPQMKTMKTPVFNTSVPPNDPAYSRGWFPDDPNASLNSNYTLSGDQCLVFFLGGIQSGGACQGFSTNRTNPTALNSKREPTMYDFPTSRLVSVDGSGFKLSYLDSYGKAPFAFFSSWGGQGYNHFGGPATPGAVSDCAELSTIWNGYDLAVLRNR